MTEAPLYSHTGEKLGMFSLPAVFGLARHDDVIFRYLRYIQAASRMPIANTQTRGDVQGGGKKPWRQKGTGRARQGSTRSPQWKGGGVVFGPSAAQNFVLRLNRKMRQLALMSVLSSKVTDQELVVLDVFSLPETKTSVLAKMLKTWPGSGKRLLIVPDMSETLMLASRNLADLEILPAHRMNLKSLLRAKTVIVTKDGVEKIQAIWGDKIAAKRLPTQAVTDKVATQETETETV